MNKQYIKTLVFNFRFFTWFFIGGVGFLFCCSPKLANERPNDLEDHWPKAGVTYEIFVRSFYDSDGDGIGDINGVRENLDHVSDLGANAIWFMPIMPSPSYHKYDVTDYKAIHPDYGTLEDFKALISEAHAQDIRIVIDLIINHTSSEHPWFLESKKGRDNPYRDYFVWAQKDTLEDYLEKKTITLDSDNIRQWHDPGFGEDFYYGFFYGGMPDLNFDNPKVREEVYEIGKFWLEEVGVDGFRLDAAKHIFPDDRPDDNHAFWKEFREKMVEIKSDIYLVGEVYDSKEIVAPYLPGLPALFNFDFHYTLLEALRTADGSLLPTKQKQVLDYYQGITDEFIDATISSNHDQPRILSDLDGDERKAKQAIAILMTMPGAPYLYYGEEIGMLGKKPDPNIREPFLWDVLDKDGGRATWIDPKFSTDETVIPLEVQKEDASSMFRHYQETIKLRNTDSVLALGGLELLDENYPKALMAYERVLDGERRIVFHNLGMERLELTYTTEGGEVVYSYNGATMDGKRLVFPPQSSLVVK
ncbi:alpha-amylase family glycosyl hydrolase [Lunatibacter salilacus]|uniref:alpha-amylase family glycosyl hydrolase n=1 Tax=Lunatibacter salilacus TaxID=2483804 RepID=UPI00131C3FBA|nr:alpha-amylase family glycosyl hydrolase [Lunatibacter salilacus]